MTSCHLPPGDVRARGRDAGSTLVVALLVASLTLLLGVLVVTQSVGAARDSGEDRQRTSQVHAAEAGIDDAYYRLQTGETPCVTTLDVGDSPDTTTVDTTLTYASDTGPVDPCTSDAIPTRALITATATSENSVGGGPTSTRTLESEVLLSPSSGNAGYAIYADRALTLPNGFSLSGDGVSSPDIYARGNLVCENSARSAGDVYVAAGSATLTNSCAIAGSLETRDSITMSNSSSVGADAYSSRGSVTVNSPARVGRDVVAWGSFGGTRSRVAGSVTTRNGVGAYLTDPIDHRLVYVGYEPGLWRDAGYDIVPPTTNCDLIKTQMFTVTRPTVFYGSCGITFDNNNTGLRLKTDVALFLTGGLTISNNFGLSSSSAADPRNLWVIVPAGSGPQPPGWTSTSCPGATIDVGNRTNIASSVHVFMYSCGTINIANNSELYGQLYARQVVVRNALSMRFVSMPPSGVDLGGQPALPGYKVEVVYKRETQP